MKLPSLDTAEGIVLLALTGFVAYVGYRAYKLGQGIPDSIAKTAHDLEVSLGLADKVAPSGTVNNVPVGTQPLNGFDLSNLWPVSPAPTFAENQNMGSALPQAESPRALDSSLGGTLFDQVDLLTADVDAGSDSNVDSQGW